MKTKYLVSVLTTLVVVIGIVSYTVMGDYMGNNIEIESVMEDANVSSTMEEENIDTDGIATAGTVLAEDMNGNWNIATGSKVYWSVTTSEETVNFVNEGVTGNWALDLNNPTSMRGEGIVDINLLDSGNSMRDSHVKERSDLLEVTEYPQATFATKSFSNLPTEWTEGISVPVTIEGTLIVKGIEKDVTFESEVMYLGGQLRLSGEKIVTFSDFGMQSPHTVLLEAENELTVQLEMVLEKV